MKMDEYFIQPRPSDLADPHYGPALLSNIKAEIATAQALIKQGLQLDLKDDADGRLQLVVGILEQAYLGMVNAQNLYDQVTDQRSS